MREWWTDHAWRLLPRYRAYLSLTAWWQSGKRYHFEAVGLCLGCGGARDGVHKYCDACRAKRADIHKTIYEARKAAGLCVKCRAPVDREGSMCQRCTDKMAGRRRMAPGA